MLQSEASQQLQLENGIRQIHAAGQGCMTLIIVSQKSTAMLVGKVMKGCPYARATLAAADRLLRKVHRRPRTRALPCLICGEAMWRCEPPGAVGALLPFGIEPVRIAVGLAFQPVPQTAPKSSWRRRR
jgi:hypothetical protein